MCASSLIVCKTGSFVGKSSLKFLPLAPVLHTHLFVRARMQSVRERDEFASFGRLFCCIQTGAELSSLFAAADASSKHLLCDAPKSSLFPRELFKRA